MSRYNPEFIKRLAMGDESAYEEVSKLTSIEKVSIGLAADEYRRNHNVAPVDDRMSIYVQDKQSVLSDEDLANSLSKLNKEGKAKELAKTLNEQENYEKAIRSGRRWR